MSQPKVSSCLAEAVKSTSVELLARGLLDGTSEMPVVSSPFECSCVDGLLVVEPSEWTPRHSGQVPHPFPLLLGVHVLGQPGVALHLPLLARL